LPEASVAIPGISDSEKQPLREVASGALPASNVEYTSDLPLPANLENGSSWPLAPLKKGTKT
jgi:hypothetical protein